MKNYNNETEGQLDFYNKFLKRIDKNIDIDVLTFYIVNNDTIINENELLNNLNTQKNVGLMSEAGCPAIADPGSNIVAFAQMHNIKVVPHLGPNSILLTLMASGFNGQCFKYNGYLPIKNPDRSKALKKLEAESISQNCTQLFIETPYRNNQMFEDILSTCNANTKVCLAINLTSETENIKTKTVAEWKKCKIDLHKIPVVFAIFG